MMSDDPFITIADMRKVYCVRGAKKAFDAAGLNFAEFLETGARASQLRGHGYDAVVDRIVDSMKTKETRDGQQ